MLQITFLALNAGAAFLHWRFRVYKFIKSNSERVLLAFVILATVALAAGALLVDRYTPADQRQGWQYLAGIGFLAAVFWVFITQLNIEVNNVLGKDTYVKQWHRWQWVQWFTFHLLVAKASTWEYSLALFAVGSFVFDGWQNKAWKFAKRVWFYVGRQSGFLDTWFSTMSYPERNKATFYIIGAILCCLPFVRRLIIG